MIIQTISRVRPRSLRLLGASALILATSGCDGLFEVNNPNQLVQEDLNRPDAAPALVNGAEASIMRALARLVLPLSAASDELRSIGSLDYGLELDLGFLSNPANDFSNPTFPFVAEARFMADEAIVALEGFDAERLLRSRADLARAYLLGGVVYTAIADSYDDFVISRRRDASPPIGSGRMATLYDRAIEYLDRGLPVSRETGRTDLELAILAQRARAAHARAIWRTLKPGPGSGGLVNDAAANTDAEAALRLLPSPDWRLQFRYGASTVGTQIAQQVNVRQEFRVGDRYIVPTADNRRVSSIRLLDPATGLPDAALAAAIQEFTNGGEYSPQTVLSARELRLILAEAALARGDEPAARVQLAAVRALTGRPAGAQVPALELLDHERAVNLFLQGRRLADQYRFRIPSPRWQPTSDAVRAPGTFLPIAQVERLSNCHLIGSC